MEENGSLESLTVKAKMEKSEAGVCDKEVNAACGQVSAKKTRRRKKDEVSEKLSPLKTAAERIAEMLCALSKEEELFVISAEEKQSRRIDTKTLKEFSSVIKEISWVICELNGISPAEGNGSQNAVRIEFSEDTEACSL